MDEKPKDNKPPSNKADMGSSTGVLPTDDTLVGRFKNLRSLWVGDWSICPVRTSVCSRRLFILNNIQEGK